MDTHAVGTVWRDLEIEDDIRGHELVEGRAGGRFGIKDEQAAVVVAKAELFAAAHHAEARHVAQFALFDGESAGQNGPRQRERNLVACLEIRRLFSLCQLLVYKSYCGIHILKFGRRR